MQIICIQLKDSSDEWRPSKQFQRQNPIKHKENGKYLFGSSNFVFVTGVMNF